MLPVSAGKLAMGVQSMIMGVSISTGKLNIMILTVCRGTRAVSILFTFKQVGIDLYSRLCRLAFCNCRFAQCYDIY